MRRTDQVDCLELKCVSVASTSIPPLYVNTHIGSLYFILVPSFHIHVLLVNERPGSTPLILLLPLRQPGTPLQLSNNKSSTRSLSGP